MTRVRDLETAARPLRRPSKSVESPRSGDAVSPLLAIRERERELAERVSAAHERAQTRIGAARARAGEIKADAEREGMAQAQSAHDGALARAFEQAESIRQAGVDQANALIQFARPRIPAAVDEIVRLVLPANAMSTTDLDPDC